MIKLLDHCRALRETSKQVDEISTNPTQPVSAQFTSHSARSQRSGLARLDAIERELSMESIISSISDNTTSSTAPTLSPQDQEALDKRKVLEEWNHYISDGVIEDKKELAEFDLCRFWTISKWKYPFMYRVVLDVLAVQASSVPCERVFSSSKETDMLRRSRLSPLMMETLQLLKFMFRSERLDFTDGLISRAEESDCIVDVSQLLSPAVELV
ncbi:hypothetical protein C0992_009943 [Termitomyces sp. T32_za158]|nr:hypothetical protein C0992_009943 [Termitomyces sp. T32_za158]